jgi:DNA-binding transcriptional ArsR family regulator
MSDKATVKKRNRGSLSDALSTSTRCEILASKRRRELLRFLQQWPDEQVPVQQLVKHLLSADVQAKNVMLSLEHVHLPKLEQEGIVEYDSDDRWVRYRRHPELERLLAFLE